MVARRMIRALNWCGGCRNTNASRRQRQISIGLPRMERDTMQASAELVERKVVRILPQVSLQEMLLALKDVMSRAEMFAHHHVHRERLSVRQRMSDILSSLRGSAFVVFTQLFRAEEGRMGVTVTFSAILELMSEGLIEIVQAEPYAALHVRPASGSRHLSVVGDDEPDESSADAENEAALAQPAQPDENVIDEEEDDARGTVSADAVAAGSVTDAAQLGLSEAAQPEAESHEADSVTDATAEEEHSVEADGASRK